MFYFLSTYYHKSLLRHEHPSTTFSYEEVEKVLDMIVSLQPFLAFYATLSES